MKPLRKLKKINVKQFANTRPPGELVELQYLIAKRMRAIDEGMKKGGFHSTDLELPEDFDEKIKKAREGFDLDERIKARLENTVYALSIKDLLKLQERLVKIFEVIAKQEGVDYGLHTRKKRSAHFGFL